MSTALPPRRGSRRPLPPGSRRRAAPSPGTRARRALRSGADRSRTGEGSATTARHARFTTRALILLGVVAVLLVSFASSLRAYVDQQAQLDDLQSQITASKAAIKDLERDKGRYADDAYLIAQARERFTFAFPGEIGYQVIGTDGQPLDRQEMLPEATSLDVERLQWWERTVTSLKEAGRRPLPGQDQPVKRLTVPPRLP